MRENFYQSCDRDIEDVLYTEKRRTNPFNAQCFYALKGLA